VNFISKVHCSPQDKCCSRGYILKRTSSTCISFWLSLTWCISSLVTPLLILSKESIFIVSCLVAWVLVLHLSEASRVGLSIQSELQTWVGSLSTQYPRHSESPPDASWWYIGICMHLPFLENDQQLLESCQVLYLQKEIIWQEQTRGTLSTTSPNTNEWRASTHYDCTTWRLELTQAIMVGLQ